MRDDREELTLEDADVGMWLNVVLRFCKVIRATRYGGLIQIKSILTFGLTREREREGGVRGGHIDSVVRPIGRTISRRNKRFERYLPH